MGVKDPCTACCLVWFFGVCGVHRCYLDDCCCGMLFALTGGFCLIGAIVDCCHIGTMTQACNAKYMGGGSVVITNNNSNSVANNVGAPQYAQQQQYLPPPQQQYMDGSAQGYNSPGAGFCASCGARRTGAPFCSGCGARA